MVCPRNGTAVLKGLAAAFMCTASSTVPFTGSLFFFRRSPACTCSNGYLCICFQSLPLADADEAAARHAMRYLYATPRLTNCYSLERNKKRLTAYVSAPPACGCSGLGASEACLSGGFSVQPASSSALSEKDKLCFFLPYNHRSKGRTLKL